MRSLCRLLLGLLGAAAAGCEARPRPVQLAPAPMVREVRYSDLRQVLSEGVGKDGRIDPEKLKRLADRLELQLRHLARVGPTATPEQFATPEAALAYWYNARSAWVLRLWLEADCPTALRRRQFEDRPFPLDGRTITLTGIDTILLRKDWGALVAAPGLRAQRAGLEREPFLETNIRSRIERRLNRFLADERRLVVDVGNRVIRAPPVLWAVRQPVISNYHDTYRTRGATLPTALLSRASGSAHRRLQEAVGYRCVPARPSGQLDTAVWP